VRGFTSHRREFCLPALLANSVDFTYTARISRPPSPASYCLTLESDRETRRERSSARKVIGGINATVSTYRQAMSTREPRTERTYSPREKGRHSLLIPHVLSRLTEEKFQVAGVHSGR